MKISILKLLTALLILQLLPGPAIATPDSEQGLNWHRAWSEDLFKLARQENKFVILDLEAVWCHWCHVMEQTTYRDTRVIELLQQKYITVRVDQDSDPDLLARYGDYGWPATIVFAADGSEIVKRRGYIDPPRMVSMLQAIIDDPSPGPSVFSQPQVVASDSASLNPAQKRALLDRYIELYDAENGGWGFIHKFINADAMDYALLRAHRGDRMFEIMARQTLHAALDLIDPQWGGVYQYSDQLDWQSPHFEKIMSIQTQYLRLYSLAWSLWEMDSHREAADSIYSYLNAFLKSPDGLYYTSQDADLNRQVDGHDYFPLTDERRRALGIPAIDKNIYTRENAWIIRSYVSYANSTGKQKPLQQALTTAELLEARFARSDGGFSHAENDSSGPYLSDNLAMAQAYIALYQATGNQGWLEKSVRLLHYIDATFGDTNHAGYINSPVNSRASGVFGKPVKQRDENSQLARIANLAYQYSGDKSLQSIYHQAMKYMTSDALLNSRFFLAGVLLAEEEAQRSPIHITIVGKKSDTLARQLHARARQYPVDYLRIDWWDRNEGALMNDDIQYPELQHSAAFACTADSCSLPIVELEKLHAEVNRLLRPVDDLQKL